MAHPEADPTDTDDSRSESTFATPVKPDTEQVHEAVKRDSLIENETLVTHPNDGVDTQHFDTPSVGDEGTLKPAHMQDTANQGRRVGPAKDLGPDIVQQNAASYGDTTPQGVDQGVGSQRPDILATGDQKQRLDDETIGPQPTAVSHEVAASANGPTSFSAGPSFLMPPPAAPASMLFSLKPSARARPSANLIKDLAIIGRLVAPIVTLFRQGKAEKARALGVFTLDCIGQAAWDEYLAEYMNAPQLQDDEKWVNYFLCEAVILMRPGYPEQAGYLNGMLDTLG